MAGAYSKGGFTTPKNGKVSSSRRNTSILNFFQKTDGPPTPTSRQPRITQFTSKVERSSFVRLQPTGGRASYSGADNNPDSLFLEDKTKGEPKCNGGSTTDLEKSERRRSRTPDDIWGDKNSDMDFPGNGDEDEDATKRYNENDFAAKKRKVDTSSSAEALGEARKNESRSSNTSASPKTKQRSGPFIDESDNEEDLEAFGGVDEPLQPSIDEPVQISQIAENSTGVNSLEATKGLSGPAPPSLVREATSHCVEDDEFADFDDVEDDEFKREHFLDWPSEKDVNEQDDTHDGTNDFLPLVECEDIPDSEVSGCPICQMSLTGLSEMNISVHVNNCLDGKTDTFSSSTKPINCTKNSTRIELAAIPRPPQRDPYSGHSGKTTGSSSAFSKLMAGNAEDAAWATAAAKESGSRGKQAYRRTCPFYKIVPGFSICVDAFRYGAVEGCNAYFLSHFHSDHYMGLSSSWRHGPIYCSKVTGNLVRQQLRVDPKWVVDIEFEKKTEIPNTGGVNVTMISANHCPGSSLFLFEKPVGPSPSARVQRILHCGDFRASPDHVQHPLLRPDAVDSATGQAKEQQVDVCYLDTTYMNPKYAFPSQEDVIRACADICVSLNQDDGDCQAPWDTEQRGLKAMSKYFSTVKDSDHRKAKNSRLGGRLLVVMGTYSIGKERIYLGIARALNCKIYATTKKKRICACLEDAELSSLLTDDPLEAQVHLQTMVELRAETLKDYLDSMRPHFTKVVGIRPTGWNYRPPAGRIMDHPPVSSVLYSDNWKTPFTARDMVPQRGSTKESACFGVPYSEHSSFRELTMFCCGLRIARIIPTVNVGNQSSRERMKAWFERWEAEKKRNGLFCVDKGWR